MAAFGDVTSAVVGTGFIGQVHVDALQRLGIRVAGVVDTGRTSVEARARDRPLPERYPSFEAMLADRAVDVVHLATPNHLHYSQAKACLDAGKHVLCEKPLAMTAAESTRLVELADAGGLLGGVGFNIRFYPQLQEARTRVVADDVGRVMNVHGAYLQDWLLHETDWNWRLDPALGGQLRAGNDIGSHWLDLVQFLTGQRIVEIQADLLTALPTRIRPAAAVQTFTTATAGGEPTEMSTDDVANILFRSAGGAHGAVVLSQVSAGRRNRLTVEVDGTAGSLSWDSDRHEELQLGRREQANETLVRDPALARGPVPGWLPAGHPEGFHETFRELFRAFYTAVVGGVPADDYPSFRDGDRANRVAEAIVESNRRRRWVAVA